MESMRWTFLRSKLQRLSSSLLIVCFGVSLTALAWTYVATHLSNERAAEIERAHRDNDAMARAFEEHVRRVLQVADEMMLFIKHEFEEYGRVDHELVEFVERARRNPILNQISVIDARGDLILSAVELAKPINLSQGGTYQVHAASASAGLLIGKPILTKAAGRWSFFVTRRLDRADGSFAGIVAIGLDPEYFSNYYEELELGAGRGVLLVGLDGIVRARRFQQESGAGRDQRDSPMFAKIPREPSGHYESVGSIDQLRQFVSYRALPDYPLVVAVSDLTTSALATYERHRVAYQIAAVVFTLFVAIFCAVLIAAARREQLQGERLSAELAERLRAEEKLREAGERYQDLFENANDAIFLLDERHRFVDANRQALEHFGFTREEFIGHAVFEFIPPEQVSRSEAAFRELVEKGQYHRFEGRMRTRDGSWRDVEVSSSAIVRGGVFSGSRDIVRDITEKLLLEEERLKTQKLESIGTLAGGIAHDFNNLLQGVFGYISMAKISIGQRDRAIAMIEQAERALHQSVSLTTQLLTFSKGGAPVREPIALEPVIENAVKFALSGSRTEYRLTLEPGLWHVDADAGQLGQVIQNIALNADQAMPLGGSVAITARNVPPSDPDLPQGLEPRNHVMISISDNGVGIPEHDLERIFDPYFTTKEKGSGLGLATSYSIVRNHEGRIMARSEAGKGTAFFVWLPASQAAAPVPTAGAAAAQTRTARILVMDDEEIIRNVTGELLAVLGHSFTFVDRGEAAIDAYRAAREAGRPFDVVILDLTIRGGMGGVETVAKLRAIDPGVKAAASSGYSDDAAQSGFREQGFSAFLKKPYNLIKLQETIEALLA